MAISTAPTVPVPLEIKMYCPHDDSPAETDSQGPQPHEELSTSSSGGGAAATTVKFNLWEEVHEVPNAKSLSKEEFNEIWYDPSDYDRMMDHCEKTVDLMEEGKRFKEKKLTALGLEHWTRTGYKKRQRNKYGGIDSVLNEQFAQWEEGVDDEESISELYQASAADSKMAAAANGLKLEREVQEYLETGTKVEVDDDCVSVLTCSVRTERTEPSVVRWTSHSTHSRSSTHSRTSVGSYVTMMNSSNHSRGGGSVASILKSGGSGGSIHSRGDNSTIGASTHSRVSVSSGAGKKIKLGKKKNYLLNSASTHSRASVASVGSVQSKSSTKGSKAPKKNTKTPKASTTTNTTPKKLKKRISTKSDSTSTESTSDSTIDSVPVVAAIMESSSTHSRGSKASKASRSSATKKTTTKKVISKKEKETKKEKKSSTSSATKKMTATKKTKKASTMEEKYNKCAEFINKHFSSSTTTASSTPAPKNEVVAHAPAKNAPKRGAPAKAAITTTTKTATTTTTPKIKKGVVTKPRVSTTTNSNKDDDFVKPKIQKRTSAYSSNRNLLF